MRARLMGGSRMPQSSDRRHQHRAPIELRVEYQRLNRFFYDYTKNISMGGTFIKTDKPLDIGTEFLFKLMIPTLPEPLVLRGDVRWVLHEGETREGEGPDGATSRAWAFGSSTRTKPSGRRSSARSRS